eukprot:6346153-Prymnesium_polylepis.2
MAGVKRGASRRSALMHWRFKLAAFRTQTLCNIADGGNEKQQQHRQPEENEEEVDPVGRFAEPVRAAQLRRHAARFDEQHARVHKDHRQLDERHEGAIFGAVPTRG